MVWCILYVFITELNHKMPSHVAHYAIHVMASFAYYLLKTECLPIISTLRVQANLLHGIHPALTAGDLKLLPGRQLSDPGIAAPGADIGIEFFLTFDDLFRLFWPVGRLDLELSA